MTNHDWLEIDGAQGEGGGQIVRTTLALSMLTGRPVRIRHIRAGRKKPGLMRQHLTAVQAAAAVTAAQLRGASLGSTSLEFRPGPAQQTDYTFPIGSAGSTTLVLQTILPALMVGTRPSKISLEGGTHNPMAPSFDFLARTYLPIVARMGPEFDTKLERPGFYPAGGGRFRITVRPAERLGWLQLVDRGTLIDQRVRILISRLPRHIAEREWRTIAESTRWNSSCFQIEDSHSPGPGNAVLIELRHEQITELFAGYGRRGVPAERVAQDVLVEAEHYLNSTAAVGPYLADQLLLPLSIAAYQGTGGGEFTTGQLTEHARTHIQLVETFLGVHVIVEPQQGESVLVRVGDE